MAEPPLPVELAAMRRQNPGTFVESTLQQLAQWESAMGIDAKGHPTRL
ncbi:MAG: hypothetical protein SV765_11685 [Pseudomonadota bacterium]|nr:hypothetical protein [Pseudomonadota bacterium]